MTTAPRPRRPLSTVLVLAGVFSAGVLWLVFGLFDGWEYYRTPIAGRGYLPAHRLLRPSGLIGLSLGAAGMVAMMSTLPYAVRKRWRPLARLGSPSPWLEVHIFFGLVGPVMVTLPPAFKFNGAGSIGYWLMMTVWASGFVGRYLYVRIPKTIRGVELSRKELQAEFTQTRESLARMPLPAAARAALDEFDRSLTRHEGRAPGTLDLFLGEVRVRARLLAMRRHLRAAGVDVQAIHDAVATGAEEATLSRRLIHLERTHRLFELWHVFHRPLVYVMFLIVSLHVALAVYLGYAQQLLGGRQ